VNILTMLWRNLLRGSQTLRFPARPAEGKGFRGRVRFDPALCSGCAICKFRCTSRAISYSAGKGEFHWSYDPGQCTFCGRCVEGCKSHALSQDPECPPVYLTIGELKESYTVARKAPAPRATPLSVPKPVPADQPIAITERKAESPAAGGTQ
jgi:formate hydrogenlyase subunit 6/NADH:ubiquinone oxidoreductase subunit I